MILEACPRTAGDGERDVVEQWHGERVDGGHGDRELTTRARAVRSTRCPTQASDVSPG